MKNSPRAFTLIEVVLALGVVSFALVSLLGLLAVGTTGLGHSIDMSTETQIIQSIDSEVANLNFSELINSSGTLQTSGNAPDGKPYYASTFPRLYDADGELLSEGAASQANGNIVYAVTLSGSSGQMPGATSSTGSNSMQLVFTIGNQLQRSGLTLSTWQSAVASGTAPNIGTNYCIWAINNGR